MTCYGNRIKFDQQIEEITQNNRTMGIEEFLLNRAEKKESSEVKKMAALSL